MNQDVEALSPSLYISIKMRINKTTDGFLIGTKDVGWKAQCRPLEQELGVPSSFPSALTFEAGLNLASAGSYQLAAA